SRCKRASQRCSSSLCWSLIERNFTLPLSQEQRAQMLVRSREAANAFVDDMVEIRRVLATEGSSLGEIRRLSAILRPLLVDRDLAMVARLPAWVGSPFWPPITIRSTRMKNTTRPDYLSAESQLVRLSFARAQKLARAAECLVHSLTPSGFWAENHSASCG